MIFLYIFLYIYNNVINPNVVASSVKNLFFFNQILRQKCPYVGVFLVRKPENTDQKISEYAHFLRSENLPNQNRHYGKMIGKHIKKY